MNDIASRVMSGAELKVQLTGLGLTTTWLADQLHITTRTVIRWCELDAVPARAVAKIDQVSSLTSEEMNRIYYAMRTDGVVRTQRTDQDAGSVQKSNHLPASWHRALTYRVLQHVRSQGSDPSVSYV